MLSLVPNNALVQAAAAAAYRAQQLVQLVSFSH
jgi:hypothetical protein